MMANVRTAIPVKEEFIRMAMQSGAQALQEVRLEADLLTKQGPAFADKVIANVRLPQLGAGIARRFSPEPVGPTPAPGGPRPSLPGQTGGQSSTTFPGTAFDFQSPSPRIHRRGRAEAWRRKESAVRERLSRKFAKYHASSARICPSHWMPPGIAEQAPATGSDSLQQDKFHRGDCRRQFK